VFNRNHRPLQRTELKRLLKLVATVAEVVSEWPEASVPDHSAMTEGKLISAPPYGIPGEIAV
jgi:hypothetical protein